MNKMFIGFIRCSDSIIDFLPNQLFLKVNTQILKSHVADFPGSTVDRNLPAKAGATGSIPGTGKPAHSSYRAHALDTSRNYCVCVPKLRKTTCLRPKSCNY